MSNFPNTRNNNKIELLNFYLFCFLPITFLFGNFSINLFSILISANFLLRIFFCKYKFYYRDPITLILFFLFLSLLINLFFSNDILLSLPRILKFLIIISIVLSFRELILNIDSIYMNMMYKIWFYLILIVSIDLIFEFFFGHNLLGQKSITPGRLGGFTGKEMVIGNFFSAFTLISLTYVYKNYKLGIYNLFIALAFISISFLIGERSNFIKTFIIVQLFIIFIYEIKIRYKIFFFLSIFTIIFLVLNFNENYKLRYFDQIKNVFKKNGLENYIDNSLYGAHYKVALKIFYDNPYFGVGIKNFRVESFNKKYEGILNTENQNFEQGDKNFKGWTGGSTHPHQIHFEILSETGIFGYSCFVIFIISSFIIFLKTYLINKNIYQFSGMLFVLVSLIPLLPSGSFFSTYTAGLFWINYAMMTGYSINTSNSKI